MRMSAVLRQALLRREMVPCGILELLAFTKLVRVILARDTVVSLAVEPEEK